MARLIRHGQLILGDLRWFLRLVFPEPEPEMAERLLEIYREWCRENGITPSSGKASESPENPS